MHFGKVLIFGVGLIGASFARGLKAAKAADKIIGFGRTPKSLKEAYDLGIIDEVGINPGTDVREADLILVATPVGQMPEIFQRIAPYLGPQTIVTDAGSTKSDVVEAARAAFGNKINQFVPGHPIAGAETSGAAASKADLYQGRKVVLTPLLENSGEDIEKIKRAWELCGADVRILDAETHDRVFAAVSHLPHLLAYALVDEFARRPNADQLFDYAAAGFRDFTRIAGSHPEMWRDISLANRMALLAELDRYGAALMRLRQALVNSDDEALAAIYTNARDARQNWSH
ncbi:MAG: Cyclohexadienyl dehydrogenase [Fluviibacter phosphoraccumulans EoVTN8]